MAEREWREASDMRTSTLGLGAVLASAALLRFWNLDHGLPSPVGPEESSFIDTVLQMMRSGDPNPHRFDWPALYFTAQLVVACVRYLAGAAEGLWESVDRAAPADFYLSARAVTAATGTLTVGLLYQAGTRWGTRHALLAAGLLAVLPTHVRESHVVSADVPLTFFAALVFLLTLRACEKTTVAASAWAGAAAGLAGATRYAGIWALLLPLIAVWMTPAGKHPRRRRALGAVAACVAAFLLAAPYTLLDLPIFLDDAGRELARWAGLHAQGSGWMVALQQVLAAMRWPALILALGGFAFGLVRSVTGPSHVRWVLLITFPVVGLYQAAGNPASDEGAVLAILPFACLLASNAVVSGVSLLRRFDIPRAPRTALIAAFTVAALVPPVVASVQWLRAAGRRSPETTVGQDHGAARGLTKGATSPGPAAGAGSTATRPRP